MNQLYYHKTIISRLLFSNSTACFRCSIPHCNEHAITWCGCGFPGYYARYGNAGRREGVREGRKQGGKLEWAAVPVLRRRRLNFKHRLLFFYHYYSVGQKWAEWASINQLYRSFTSRSRLYSSRPTSALTGNDGEWWGESRCWERTCFVLSVGFLCPSASEMLASSQGSQGAKVKGKPVRILIAVRWSYSLNILLQRSC